MDIEEKLRYMQEQQLFGAIQLKDHQQFIATVQEIEDSQVVFFDHSPNECNPVIETPIDRIASIEFPEVDC